MLNLRAVFFLLGMLISAFAGAMLLPIFIELFIYETPYWQSFLAALFISGGMGVALSLANKPDCKIVLGTREAFLVTTLSWFLIPFFAGLPFYWSHLNLTFIDACFEAASALTTTGSTVIENLDKAPRGVLLWRAILQWLGGTGIIVMAMTVFPVLRIGGMQLFRSEFSDRSEKILPRVSQIAAGIIAVYSFFTVLCGVLLNLAGMDGFDSICHALATVSTGGMSTRSASLAYYNSFLIELIVVAFMIVGGSSLILYVRFLNGEKRAFINDSQLRFYFGSLLLFTLLGTIWLHITQDQELFPSFRQSLFNIVSVHTSTGFTSANYDKWGSFFQFLILIVSLIGGCTGSTSGGIKIFRIQVILSLVRTHLKQLRRPHGVYIPIFNRQKLPEAVATSVFAFLVLYCVSLMVLSTVLTGLGLDIVSSISAAALSLGNAGAGIGPILGPSTSFLDLSDSIKFVMIVGMIVGRLELLTVLVFLMPSFWRD